jgi:flagella basal body P-ring formation protein FlgA
VLDVPPTVRAGDVVTVTATVGAVQVTAAATASSSGHRGDTIRVTPKPNGRPIRARITGPAAVEVVQ